MNNRVTVVFDGHPDHNGFFPGAPVEGASAAHDIRVIFSDGCSADDKIKLMVEELADKKNCVVVSNDKDIFLYARSLGAQIMSVEAFTSVRSPRRGSAGSGFKPEPEDGKYISLNSQEMINRELLKKWLGGNP